MIDNLVYVFLENTFTLKDDNKFPYTYNELPDYYLDTLNFNKNRFKNSYLLLTEHQINLVKNKVPEGIELISVESLHSLELYKQFNDVFNSQWAHYKKDVFLYHAFLRVLYFCLFVYKNNLINSIHAEADNLIYSDNIDPFNAVFSSGEFGFSNEKYTNSAPAIIFLKDKQSAENLINLHIKLLKKGESNIVSTIGIPFHYITDMNFLFLIFLYGKDYKMLPCLPFGEQGKNFEIFNMVFDPTSYGQNLGGTNNGHSKGYVSREHFVGNEIHHKTIEVMSKNKKPFIIYNSREIPLFNLHVQNKNSIKDFLY